LGKCSENVFSLVFHFICEWGCGGDLTIAARMSMSYCKLFLQQVIFDNTHFNFLRLHKVK